MAHLSTIPDNTKNPVITGSLSIPNLSVAQFKLIPKNPDGTVFDCTGTTSATMLVGQPTIGTPATQVALSFTVTTADATGLTLNTNGASLLAFVQAIASVSNRYSMSCNTATDDYIAAVGNVNVSVGP